MALYALKKQLFCKPKVFLLQKTFLTALESCLLLQTKKFSICKKLSSLFSKVNLFRAKSFSFAQAFLRCPQKLPFCVQKAVNSHKPFLIAIQNNSLSPSVAHFCPAITYCPPKNNAVLLIFALTPYAVTPEPRTDSKPFRRRFVRKTGFDSCRRKTLLKSSSTEL